MSPAPKTEYAAAMHALAGAAAAFRRAQDKGYVWLDGDSGMLFAIEADVPSTPANPNQLQLEGN